MGYALAEAAANLGAQVTLITGPTNLLTSAAIDRVNVKTASEMHEAVMSRIKQCDIFIAAAAVSDYRVAKIAPSKIKKDKESLTLDLVKNHDILSDVAALPKRPFVVGFAAETEDLLKNAKQKLTSKKLDMIVANLVSDSRGFDQPDNAVTVLTKDGKQIDLPLQSKEVLGYKILELID